MVEEPVFRGIIDFFNKIGIYDVVLPFVLVFTIVFAILEKTRVFGTDEIEGVKYSKKNINSMVAFVVGFLVVASTKLVALINEAMANVAVLLLVSICFLLLIGSFYKEGEGVFLEGGWKILFMIIMFIGVALIFLHAVRTEDGDSWLEWAWDWLVDNWSTNAAASIILVIVVIVVMLFVVYEKKPQGAKKEKA